MKNKQMNNKPLSFKLTAKKQIKYHKQQGVVLIWAIVFMVVITILGLSAVRMSGIDTQIAGNSMTTMLTYQGAESTLVVAGDYYYVDPASRNGGVAFPVPPIDLPPEPVGQGNLNSRATVQFEAADQGCPKNVANSSKFKCSVYRIQADSGITGSSTKSTHTMGWAEKQALINN